MIIKNLVIEDFNSYKDPTTTVQLPLDFEDQPIFDMPDEGILETFIYNKKTQGLVIKTLTGINDSSFKEIIDLLRKLRVEYKNLNSVFILYTECNKEDMQDKLRALRGYVGPVIVKFGKPDPALPPKWDSVLGTTLSSANQYAERIC